MHIMDRDTNYNFFIIKKRSVLALKCPCSIYLKYILNVFWNVKKFKQKFHTYISASYVLTMSFHKKSSYRVACIKRQNLLLK